MRIAIITGASSGIGEEFVRQIPRCYKNLDELWLVARSTEKLERIKKEIESEYVLSVRLYDGDLLRDYIFYRIEKDLAIFNPNIRILVNGAGFGKVGTVDEIDNKSQEQMVELNCKALTRMTCLCMDYLSKGSRIINIASASAFLPQPKFVVYAATKSYVLSFSRGLSMELADREIIVTAVCPGPVDTPFFKVAGSSDLTAKKAVMVHPKIVVRQALYDARKKKEISICTLAMKGVRIASKILPDSFLRAVMIKMFYNTK